MEVGKIHAFWQIVLTLHSVKPAYLNQVFPCYLIQKVSERFPKFMYFKNKEDVFGRNYCDNNEESYDSDGDSNCIDGFYQILCTGYHYYCQLENIYEHDFDNMKYTGYGKILGYPSAGEKRTHGKPWTFVRYRLTTSRNYRNRFKGTRLFVDKFFLLTYGCFQVDEKANAKMLAKFNW